VDLFIDEVTLDFAESCRGTDQQKIENGVFVVFNLVDVLNHFLMVLIVAKCIQILIFDQVVLNNLACRRKESLSHSWHCDIDPFRTDEFPPF
jgi:hypothetical protein